MKSVHLTYKNFFGIINKNKALAAKYLLKSKAGNPWVAGSSPVFIFVGEVAQLEEQRKTILKVPSIAILGCRSKARTAVSKTADVSSILTAPAKRHYLIFIKKNDIIYT